MYTFKFMLILMTIATLLASVIIPAGGYTPANVNNPLNDLMSGFGFTPSTTGSITTSSTQTPSNVQHSAALQGCSLGVVAGIVAGGIAVGILTGGIGIPVVIGAAAAGLTGCGIGAYIGNTFPSSTNQIFNSIVSATGPLGTFLQGILTVEQYVYPFITFALDWIPYENALLMYEPAFAALMGVFVAISSLLWLMYIAELFRGIPSVG